MKVIQLRIDLTELESILRKASKLKDNEHLTEAHIEPGELVLRGFEEDAEPEKLRVVLPKEAKELNCPACGKTVSRVHYTEHGTKVLLKSEFGSGWEDDLYAGDCAFFCPECDAELDTEELVEAGIM